MGYTVRTADLASMREGERSLVLEELCAAAQRPQNGQAAVMDARIREFEQRYEMSSRDLLERLVTGAVKETAEISRWLFWLEARANGADG